MPGSDPESRGPTAVSGDAARSRTELQLVCFRMGGEEFGLSIMRVREIVRPLRIARVPRAPSFVEGVVNLRGTILPVVDLRKRLGVAPVEDERRTRFLVVTLSGSVVLFVVDEVSEVVRAARDAVLPPPPLVRGIDASYLIGVLPLGERLIMLLHPERVLTQVEAAELRRLSADVAAGAA